jgi:hypothetical protein
VLASISRKKLNNLFAVEEKLPHKPLQTHVLYDTLGMFGMRNFRYRYTEKIIPILSVYRFSFDNYKGKFFNRNLKEILSNSKRENDNFEAASKSK